MGVSMKWLSMNFQMIKKLAARSFRTIRLTVLMLSKSIGHFSSFSVFSLFHTSFLTKSWR